MVCLTDQRPENKKINMSLYYYIIGIPALVVLAVLIRAGFLLKKDLPADLFALALKDENSGNLESAMVTYQTALQEVRKSRFHRDLEQKITEKLKVLHTVIEYNRNFHYER